MKNITPLFLAALSLSTISLYAQPTQPQAKVGVLLMAHGGSAKTWNDEVNRVASQVDPTIPTEVAFGMATRSAMQAGIDRLATRGVTQVVAVPLFVSSHSSVIDSISYLLGQSTTMPEDLKMFAKMDHGTVGSMTMDHGKMDHAGMDMSAKPAAPAVPGTKPITSSLPVVMSSALDHHHIVAEILKDRAASISKDQLHEVVILVAHGPVPDDTNKLWLADMRILADQLRPQAHYANIEYLTLRDDADDPVRNAATEELRQRIVAINSSGKRALIVPLLLSFGGIEDGLRKRLDGLDYTMAAQGLIPDARISIWVIENATTASAHQ